MSSNNDPFRHDPGPRVTRNQDVLLYENEKDEIHNKAIPFQLIAGRKTKQDWQDLVASELSRDEPRKRVIGYANRKILYCDENEEGENQDGT